MDKKEKEIRGVFSDVLKGKEKIEDIPMDMINSDISQKILLNFFADTGMAEGVDTNGK